MIRLVQAAAIRDVSSVHVRQLRNRRKSKSTRRRNPNPTKASQYQPNPLDKTWSIGRSNSASTTSVTSAKPTLPARGTAPAATIIAASDANGHRAENRRRNYPNARGQSNGNVPNAILVATSPKRARSVAIHDASIVPGNLRRKRRRLSCLWRLLGRILMSTS